MADFREAIPTVTGPGIFLIFLVFLALLLTSSETLELALDWQKATALFVISIPTSIFITQTYHGVFTKFGFGMKAKYWGDEYKKYKKDMCTIDSMVDYLSYKNGLGDKQWLILQKKAIAYHNFSILRAMSVFFLFCYSTFLYWNKSIGHLISEFLWNGFGVFLVLAITFSLGVIFHLSCKETWKAFMILDKELIRENINSENIKSCLDSWIERELQKEETKVTWKNMLWSWIEERYTKIEAKLKKWKNMLWFGFIIIPLLLILGFTLWVIN